MAKSKWPQVQDKLDLVEEWARNGLTEDQIAKNLGISRSTLSEYKKKYSDLSDALKKGKEPFIAELENALAKRALGYDYEEVKTYIKETPDGPVKYSEKTVRHLPPDVGAIMSLLKNKAPDRYTNDRAALNLKEKELELRKMIEEARAW